MTLILDPPCHHGTLRFAVLCDYETTTATWPTGASLQGRKVPAAVIMAEAGRLAAWDLSGRLLDIGTLDLACPGLIDTMQHPSGE